MRGLSSTTFKQWFGSASLLVNPSFIWQLSILSYYAQGVLLQAIEGFLPPAYVRFLIINLKPLGLFQTCGPATWGEWSPCKIFLGTSQTCTFMLFLNSGIPITIWLTDLQCYVSMDMVPSGLPATWYNPELKNIFWKFYFQTRTFASMSATS